MKAILFVTEDANPSDRRMPAVSLFELPLYDQPALQYSIANLMSWSIREILILGPVTRLKRVLGDGADYGLSLTYANLPKRFDLFALLQQHATWLEGGTICCMSAHNFFWGESPSIADQAGGGATIVAKRVPGFENYSWLEIDSQPWRVPDLGFYHPSVLEIARQMKSARSLSLDLELLNRFYAANDRLQVVRLGGEVAWCDLQDLESLWSASRQAAGWEEMTECKAACLEEAALHMGLIDAVQAVNLYQQYPPGSYRDYLARAFVASGIWPEEQRGLRLVQ